ncbi:MAG: 2-hydroxyacyl-CoA dehydratase family protein, partial [Syntrophales bacterium]|nr:2-hydroxyacyl-CoA dehydratase family protein [Syntrophales bacterium]
PEALTEAVAVMDEIRRAMAVIYERRERNPALLSGSDLWALTRAVMVMDRREAAALLKGVATSLENVTRGEGQRRNTKRVVLAGGICNVPDIYTMLEEAGGEVVGDDFCTGSRYFAVPAGNSPDPLAAIADRYINRVVCPAKHQGLFNRADHLQALAQQRGAQGIIMVLLKFCDPHAFDYPYLKNALEKAGIPVMLLEIEDPLPPKGQILTRIEAFLEIL